MLFDHRLWLFGTSFHTSTFIILAITWVINLYLKHRYHMDPPWALVHSTAVVSATVHYYELIHASFEWVYAGFFSKSALLLNLPCLATSIWIAYRMRPPKPHPTAPPSLIAHLTAFTILGATGFYKGYPKTLLWVITKILASTTIIATIGLENQKQRYRYSGSSLFR